MGDVTDSCEGSPSQVLNDVQLFRSNHDRRSINNNNNNRPAASHPETEIVTLRSQNLQLQSQVQNLTRQLQSCTLQPRHENFALFSRLPPELRRKIWRHALPAARIVSVDFAASVLHGSAQFEANHAAPVLLRVCRESREVALENYELAFAGSIIERARARVGGSSISSSGGDGDSGGGSGNCGFHFDFAADTLCFTRETMPLRIVLFLEDMDRAEVRRVRNLAVGTELPKDVMKYITQFHGLEVFSLILSDPRVVAPRGRFGLVEADHRSIWVMGAYWNHELTSWGRMEALITEAFEEARLMTGECSVPRVEFVYAVSTEEGCCRDCPGHEQ